MFFCVRIFKGSYCPVEQLLSHVILLCLCSQINDDDDDDDNNDNTMIQ